MTALVGYARVSTADENPELFRIFRTLTEVERDLIGERPQAGSDISLRAAGSA